MLEKSNFLKNFFKIKDPKNEMDFFTPTERLNDDLLKELSNQWMMYYLTYHQKRNIIKDPMCENHPLNR